MARNIDELLKFAIDMKAKINASKIPLTGVQVVTELSVFSNIPIPDLQGPRRTQDLADTRQVGFYLLGEDGVKKTLKSIGTYFGGRDHSTVIHGRDKIRDLIKQYKLTYAFPENESRQEGYSATGNE